MMMTLNKNALMGIIALLLIVPFLLGQSKKPKATPAPKVTGPIVYITPQKGKPGGYELIRVYADHVEVKEMGGSLTFGRTQIAQVKIPDAEAKLQECVQALISVESANVASFPQVLSQLETNLPTVQSLANRYSWLLPGAAETVGAYNQTISDMRKTIEATTQLNKQIDAIDRIAAGKSPLSATWETEVNQALEDTNAIPYLQIRREILGRFLSIRQQIQHILTNADKGSVTRIRAFMDELKTEMASGRLTEEGAELRLKVIRQQLERVLLPENQQEFTPICARMETQVRGWLKTRKEALVAEAVSSISNEIMTASDETVLSFLSPRIQEAEKLVLNLPESATRENLRVALAEQNQIIRESSQPKPTPTPNQQMVAEMKKVERTRRYKGYARYLMDPKWLLGGALLVFVLLRLRDKWKKSRILKALDKGKFERYAPSKPIQLSSKELAGSRKEVAEAPPSPAPSEPPPSDINPADGS